MRSHARSPFAPAAPYRFLVAALLSSSVLVAGCDGAGDDSAPVTTGALSVQASFLDGSPALALIEAYQLVPTDSLGRWLEEPFLGTNHAESSSASFGAVPADDYLVTVESYRGASNATVRFPLTADSYSADTVTVDASGAEVQGFIGITGAVIAPQDGLPAAFAEFDVEGDYYPRVRAHVQAVRFAPGTFRVGDRTDLVRWVRLGQPIEVTDEVARQATVRVYAVAEGITWDGADDLTYEDVTAVEPYATYTVDLEPDPGGQGPNRGCVLVELSADFFFGALNGIAVVVEGEAINQGQVFYDLAFAYAWDGGNPHDRMPNCEGGYGWPGD